MCRIMQKSIRDKALVSAGKGKCVLYNITHYNTLVTLSYPHMAYASF